MNRFKSAVRKILFVKTPWNFIIALPSFALVAAVFLLQWENTPVAYAAYLWSAYGLCLMVTAILVPLIKGCERLLRRIPVIDRLYTDNVFRARYFLYQGTAINIVFALFKLISGLVYRSFWFIAVAVYYFALCVIRFPLVNSDMRLKKQTDGALLWEWRSYRRTGILLLLLHIALTGIMIQVIWSGKSYSYRGSLIFVMAFYTFYRIILVPLQVARGRKKQSPLFAAAREINLAVAVVAMFSLQTAMLSAFGTDARFIAVLNSATGIVVLTIVFGISVYMTIRAQKAIKALRRRNAL